MVTQSFNQCVTSTESIEYINSAKTQFKSWKENGEEKCVVRKIISIKMVNQPKWKNKNRIGFFYFRMYKNSNAGLLLGFSYVFSLADFWRRLEIYFLFYDIYCWNNFTGWYGWAYVDRHIGLSEYIFECFENCIKR